MCVFLNFCFTVVCYLTARTSANDSSAALRLQLGTLPPVVINYCDTHSLSSVTSVECFIILFLFLSPYGLFCLIQNK